MWLDGGALGSQVFTKMPSLQLKLIICPQKCPAVFGSDWNLKHVYGASQSSTLLLDLRALLTLIAMADDIDAALS